MKVMTNIRTTRQRGQAIAEMGIVVLLFVVLTLGIIDFGRMLMVLNVITHAARDGARLAALTPDSQWTGTSLGGTPLTTIRDRMRVQMATVLSDGDADSLANSATVTRTQSGSAVGEEAQVVITGEVPFLFSFPGLWGDPITVDRTATYRFEG
jgi:Flp pilus assembly protein TadG